MSYANLEKINQDYETKKAEIEAKTVDDTYTQAQKDTDLKVAEKERDDAIAAEEAAYSNMQTYLSKGATTINHKTIEAETKEVETYMDNMKNYTINRLSDASKEHLRALPSINQRTTYQYLTIFSKYQALLDKNNTAYKTYSETYDSTKEQYETTYKKTEKQYDDEIEAINKRTITDEYTEDDRKKDASDKAYEKADKLQEINTNKKTALDKLSTDYNTLKAEITADIAQLSEDNETGFTGNVQVDQNLIVKGDINLEGFIVKGKNEIDVSKLLTSKDIEKMMTTDAIITATATSYTDTTVPSAKLTFDQLKAVSDKIPTIVKTDTEDKYLLPSIYSKSKVNELLDEVSDTIPTITRADTEDTTTTPTVYSATKIDELIKSSTSDDSKVYKTNIITYYRTTTFSWRNNDTTNYTYDIIGYLKPLSRTFTAISGKITVSVIGTNGYYEAFEVFLIYNSGGGVSTDFKLVGNSLISSPNVGKSGIYLNKVKIDYLNNSYALAIVIDGYTSAEGCGYRITAELPEMLKLYSDSACSIEQTTDNYNTAQDLTGFSKIAKESLTYTNIYWNEETRLLKKELSDAVSDMITGKVDKTHITTYYRTATHSYRLKNTGNYSYDTIGYIKPINRTFTLISGKIKVSVVGSMECCEMFEVSIVYKASGTATKDFSLIGTSLKAFPSIGKSGIILKQVDEDKSAYEVAIVIDDYTTVEGCGYRITAELPDMMKLYSDSVCTTEQSTDVINTLQSIDAFGRINKEELTYNNIYWNEETRLLKSDIPKFLKTDTESEGSALNVYSKGKIDELIENFDDNIKDGIPLLNPFKDKWISVVTDDYYDCPPYTIGYNNNSTATSGLDVSQFWWYKLIRDLGAKKGPIYVDPTLQFNETIGAPILNKIFADGIRMKKGETYYDIDDARTQRTYTEDDRYADVVIFAIGNNSYWYDTTRPTLAQWKTSMGSFIDLAKFQFTPIYLPLSPRYSETTHNFVYPENTYNEILYNGNYDILKIPLGEILFNTTDIVDVKFGTNNIHLWDDCGNFKIAHMIYTKMLTSGINLCAEDGTSSTPVNYQTVALAQMIEDCVADTDVVVNATDTVDNPDKQVASITYVSGITNGMLTKSNVQNEDVVATVAETNTEEETKIMVPSVAYMNSKLTAIGDSYDDLDDRLSSVEAFINKIQIVDS